MLDRVSMMLRRRKLYSDVFKTEAGREVLKDLLLHCGMDLPSYRPGDTHGTAYAEGRRSVGLHIFNVLNTDPTQFKEDMADER